MNFFDRDFDLADALKKADEGDVRAIDAVLGYITNEGDGEEDLQEIRKKYILKLVDMDSPVGYIMLGECYKDGDLFEKDGEKALELYQKAVDHGLRFGNECIGEMYYYGDGVERNFQNAFDYLTKNTGNKSPVTDYLLGEMYRLGLYVEIDEEEAENHYLKIVQSDIGPKDAYYGPAAYRLAEYYYNEHDLLEKAWAFIEEAKKDINPGSLIAKKVGITEEMINDLWLMIFKEKEYGE